jgi:Family of unknown function (DUF5906)
MTDNTDDTTNEPDDVLSSMDFQDTHAQNGDGALDDDEIIHHAREKIAAWKAAGTPSLAEVQRLFNDAICANASPVACEKIIEAIHDAFGDKLGSKQALKGTWRQIAKDYEKEEKECAQAACEKKLSQTELRELCRLSGEEMKPGDSGVSHLDFYFYAVKHAYMFAPSREMWPGESVDARVPPVKIGVDDEDKDITVKATFWIENNRPVEMITWAPGLPMIVRDRLISEGGWIERKDVSCFNRYIPPTIELGDASEAEPWLNLVHKVFPNDADHIVKWLAHRRQRPQEKTNHCLVLGSQEQGIGKDTILEGAKRAVGPWNFKEILPPAMFGTFNPFLRSVILRISETKDMGDVSRYEFYAHTKSYLAAPPDVLECNEKYIQQHYVLNCVGVVITTNHLTDGIYLPPEDRRHFVAWSDRKPTDFPDGYWNKIYKWYDDGGDRHVAAYLDTLDISDFNPKAPPPKTPAFWRIVNANRTTEEGEMADCIDGLGNPAVVTIKTILKAAFDLKLSAKFREWLNDNKSRKAVNHRLEDCGYQVVVNPAAESGMWNINARRQMVYARSELSSEEQLEAAKKMQRDAAEAAKKEAVGSKMRFK